MSETRGRWDVIVIGGGITGTSTAFELAARGVRKVLLLEQSTIAAEASGRTGALLRRHYSNSEEARLAHLGWSTFREWNDRIGGDCGFVPHPLLITMDTRGENRNNLVTMQENVRSLREIGVSTEVVTPEDVSDAQPFLNTGDFDHAVLEHDSGYVDAVAATRSMAEAAQRNGVKIEEGVTVYSIQLSAGSVSGLKTSIGDIAADVVVCANGSWSPLLLDEIGISLPVEAMRVQIAILQRPMTIPDDHYILLDIVGGVFSRPWAPGRSLVGLAGGDQHDPVDPRDYERRNDSDFSEKAISGITHRIPAMSASSYLHGHGCLYDMTPDAHPVLGLTDADGLFLAVGFSGAGFKKGPAVGQCLAELITTGVCSTVDLSRFALSRFQSDAWKRPWSEHQYTFSSDFGHGL